jgi:hypothetical protein
MNTSTTCIDLYINAEVENLMPLVKLTDENLVLEPSSDTAATTNQDWWKGCYSSLLYASIWFLFESPSLTLVQSSLKKSCLLSSKMSIVVMQFSFATQIFVSDIFSTSTYIFSPFAIFFRSRAFVSTHLPSDCDPLLAVDALFLFLFNATLYKHQSAM